MDGIKTNSPGLASAYDSIKAGLTANSNPLFGTTPTGTALISQLKKSSDCLKDKCYKHILLDLYCRIIPLDVDFVNGNMKMMNADIDNMLKSKSMTPTQYMVACSESTKAPLFSFIINSVNGIAHKFFEDSQAAVEEAKEKNMDIPVPEAPEDPEDDEDVNSQLVDIESDTEYDTFVDILKKKTIDKIVDDVTKIINDKEEDADMSFDPKPESNSQAEMESSTSVAMNYLQYRLIKEGVDVSNLTETMLGYAIREATLNQIDLAANIPGSSLRDYSSRIRFGKGVLVNESAVVSLMEAAQKSKNDVDKVIEDANKERDNKINSKLKASDVVNCNKDKDKNE